MRPATCKQTCISEFLTHDCFGLVDGGTSVILGNRRGMEATCQMQQYHSGEKAIIVSTKFRPTPVKVSREILEISRALSSSGAVQRYESCCPVKGREALHMQIPVGTCHQRCGPEESEAP